MTKQTYAEGTSLDSDLGTFRDDLQKAPELVVRLYEGLDRVRVTPAKSRMEIASLFDEPFPEEPQPMEAILREVKNIFTNSTLYLPPPFPRIYQHRRKPCGGSWGAVGVRSEPGLRQVAFFSGGFRGGTAGDPMDRAVYRLRSRSGRMFF